MAKLVCFDLDGVLVDACELHRVALENAMMDEVNYVISKEDHESKYNGLPTRKKLKMLGLDDRLIEKINSRKQEYTINLISEHIQVDNVKKLVLDMLHQNHFLACVTNSIGLTTNLMLSRAGIKDRFDLIVTNEMPKNPKPLPDPYIYAMNFFNVDPADTIIVEDSEVGLKSAYASGANVIKVKDPTEVNLKLVEQICKY